MKDHRAKQLFAPLLGGACDGDLAPRPAAGNFEPHLVARGACGKWYSYKLFTMELDDGLIVGYFFEGYNWSRIARIGNG